MDDLKTLLAAHGGVLSTVLAARVGVTSDDVRGGAGRGGWSGSRAVFARKAPKDLASHHAALALRSLPLWRVNLRRIDVVADV